MHSSDERGWLKDAYSADGLHPNAEGYKVMTGVLSAAIQKAIAVVGKRKKKEDVHGDS